MPISEQDKQRLQQAKALYENAANYTSIARDKPHLNIASLHGACNAATATPVLPNHLAFP